MLPDDELAVRRKPFAPSEFAAIPTVDGTDRAPPEPPRGEARASGPALDPTLATWWLNLDQRPRLMLDGAYRVIWCNEAARLALSGAGPLRIDSDRLVFDDPAHAKLAERLLREAGAAVRRCTLICDGEGLDGVALGVWGDGAGHARRVFVKVTLLNPALGVRESGMAAHFGLTPAEATIVDVMLQADTPAAIARILGVSVHTVRSHLQRIYAKVGVRTQTQLVRLALVFCAG